MRQRGSLRNTVCHRRRQWPWTISNVMPIWCAGSGLKVWCRSKRSCVFCLPQGLPKPGPFSVSWGVRWRSSQRLNRLQALTWCQDIAAASASGVLDFLSHFADLHRRLPGQRLQPWVTTGLAVAQRNAEAGQAYFALESAAAQDRLQALQSLVAFAHIEPVLRLYTEALLGRPMTLRTTADLPAGLQMAGPRCCQRPMAAPSLCQSRSAILPLHGENFAAYKVAIMHQVGFYECGTFQFDVSTCAQRVVGVRPYLSALDLPARSVRGVGALVCRFSPRRPGAESVYYPRRCPH